MNRLVFFMYQLGHGGRAGQRQPKAIEAIVAMNTVIKQVECTNDCTFFLTMDGRLLACGSNYYGLLGNGDESRGSRVDIAEVDFGGVIVSSIACGDEHCAAISHDGRAYTWGIPAPPSTVDLLSVARTFFVRHLHKL